MLSFIFEMEIQNINKQNQFNLIIICFQYQLSNIILLMQSNQNSFRLGRLSHTSDFRKHSVSQYTNNPKDTLKLAALTSISRGVKYNDLSFITGRQLPKLRKQPEEGGQNLQYVAAHENLTSIRKKYDTIGKQKLQVQAKINLFKEQKQKYKIIENEYLSNRDEGGQEVKSLQDRLTSIKLLHEESQWNRKVMQSSAQKIRHDKVVYDQRKYDLNKQLEHLRKQLKIFVKEGTGINQQTDRTSKVYDKLLNQLQAEQNQRQAHLTNLDNMLGEKHQVNQSNSLRKNEIEEIALKAMQDKDDTQKNWINVLQVNKFVDRLLRNKMNHEMDKFSVVEIAFKNIKIATGVSDSQQLIFKFLNKEQVYGELLSKIADNQKRILELKQVKQQHLKERKGLKQDKQQFFNIKKEEINLRNELKEVEELSVKVKNAQLNYERIRNWIVKNLKKIHNIQKSAQENVAGRAPTEISTNFKKYLQVISEQIDKCGNIDLNLQDTVQEQVRPDSKMFRVKAKSKKINHSGQEIQNEFEEEDIPHLYEQQEVVGNQRLQILKGNQKFMKELKKKVEETKKLRIQAQPKKKATTSPQKKPAQIVQQQ